MRNSKLREADLPAILPGEGEEDAHLRVALEQSALYSTRLAIARWSSGASIAQMQVDASLRQTPQARWYAGVQSNFQAWLERGGFSQDDGTEAQPFVPARNPATWTIDSIRSDTIGL